MKGEEASAVWWRCSPFQVGAGGGRWVSRPSAHALVVWLLAEA